MLLAVVILALLTKSVMGAQRCQYSASGQEVSRPCAAGRWNFDHALERVVHLQNNKNRTRHRQRADEKHGDHGGIARRQQAEADVQHREPEEKHHDDSNGAGFRLFSGGTRMPTVGVAPKDLPAPGARLSAPGLEAEQIRPRSHRPRTRYIKAWKGGLSCSRCSSTMKPQLPPKSG